MYENNGNIMKTLNNKNTYTIICRNNLSNIFQLYFPGLNDSNSSRLIKKKYNVR